MNLLLPDLLPRWIALIDAAVWATWSVLVGYRATRLPWARLAEDTWLTRPRRWERDGRVYERLGILRWKDRIPEAGSVFRRGTSKRALPGRSDDDLGRFAAETRRAEIVHWQIMAITPVFVFFNPPVLIVAMVIYAVVANIPCIAIQRYNRIRITRILGRRRARRTAVRPDPSTAPTRPSPPGGSAGTGEGVSGLRDERSDGTARVVIVDQAHRLHEGEHRGGSDEAPAPSLQAGREGLRRR